jgi:nicotinamidase-related amidase
MSGYEERTPGKGGIEMHQHLSERGGTTVLLVIDVQNAVVEDGWDSEGVVDRIGKLIDAARASDVPVIYIQHEVPGHPVMGRGAEGWHIRPEIAPLTGEPVIAKQYGDAFVETTLPETLASLGAGHLIISGAQSDACVRATSHRALIEGYDITLVSDAHTTSDAEHDGVVIPAQVNVAQVNYASPWIGYPDTTSSLANHLEVIASFSLLPVAERMHA